MLGLTLVSYFQFFNKNNFIKFFSPCRFHFQNPHQSFSLTVHLKLPRLNFFWDQTFWHFSVFQTLWSWGRACQDCKSWDENCLDVWYHIVTHSMAVVPETISSITSSEYRLRGLLYLGVFTLVFGYSSESDFQLILPLTCQLWWRREPAVWSPDPASWPPRSKLSDPLLPSRHQKNYQRQVGFTVHCAV